MTYNHACEAYLKGSPRASEIVRRLMDWNPKLTCKENAKKLNIAMGTLEMFKLRYRLKSRAEEGVRGKYKRTLIGQELDRAAKYRKMGLTFAEVGMIYGLSRQRVEQVLKSHKKRLTLKG